MTEKHKIARQNLGIQNSSRKERNGTGKDSKLRECIMHLETKRNYGIPRIRDRIEEKVRLRGRARK